MNKVRSLVLGFSVLVSACSAVNPYYDASKAHHRPDGFVNIDGTRQSKPFSELLKWQWQAFRAGHPKPPSTVMQGYKFPLAPNQMEMLKANKEKVTITWVGHATLLVQMGGLNILTDPIFSERSSPVQFAGPKRRAPLPFTVKDLPRIDAVVISHNHYDHLDLTTVKQLANQPGGAPLFFVPLGVDLWFKDQGIQSVERFDWWQTRKFGNVEFHFVPAYHWSSRTPFDRSATLWGGWVIKQPEFSFYFSGDTGFGYDWPELAKRFGQFDFSAIAVGAYEPRWFMKEQHVNPDEAVQMHKLVKSKQSMGIHWGTFELTDEPLDQPIVDLAQAIKKHGLNESDFVLFKHGETRVLR